MKPRLNRPLVLEERAQSADGAGGYAESWVPLGTLWAELKAGAGSEAAQGLARVSRAKYRVTVRAAPHGAPSRPKPDQRLRDGDRVFAIQAVTEADLTARFLICHVTEEVAS